MANDNHAHAVHFEVDYPEHALDRVSTAFRLFYLLPIALILGLVTNGFGRPAVVERDERESVVHQLRDHGVYVPADVEAQVREPPATSSGGPSVAGGLFVATALMLAVRRRYPRWWFDFARELARFSARVGAYAALLTDRYPSTEDEQAVHLDLPEPDAAKLDRFLPLVKWLLAIPHYIVLFILAIGAVIAVIAAWFAILFTGHYPRALFDYVVGVMRWGLRVQAYAFLLVTDDYPPFTLGPVEHPLAVPG